MAGTGWPLGHCPPKALVSKGACPGRPLFLAWHSPSSPHSKAPRTPCASPPRTPRVGVLPSFKAPRTPGGSPPTQRGPASPGWESVFLNDPVEVPGQSCAGLSLGPAEGHSCSVQGECRWGRGGECPAARGLTSPLRMLSRPGGPQPTAQLGTGRGATAARDLLVMPHSHGACVGQAERGTLNSVQKLLLGAGTQLTSFWNCLYSSTPSRTQP